MLFNDSILHNIKYGRMDATIEEVYAAADAAQIRTFIESLPEKVNLRLNDSQFIVEVCGITSYSSTIFSICHLFVLLALLYFPRYFHFLIIPLFVPPVGDEGG